MSRYIYVGGWPAILCGLSYADGTIVENQAPQTGTVTVDPGDVIVTDNPAAHGHPALRPAQAAPARSRRRPGRNSNPPGELAAQPQPDGPTDTPDGDPA